MIVKSFICFLCVYSCFTVAFVYNVSLVPPTMLVFMFINVYLSDRGLIITGSFLYTTPQNDVVWKSQKFCLFPTGHFPGRSVLWPTTTKTNTLYEELLYHNKMAFFNTFLCWNTIFLCVPVSKFVELLLFLVANSINIVSQQVLNRL